MTARRRGIALAAVAAILGAGLFLVLRPGGPAASLVVVVLVDTLRQDAVGAFGGPSGATPWFDRIAARGAAFPRAMSTSGWTLPAAGSLLTGTWPTLHGGLGKDALLTPIRDEVPTAAELFRAAGFRTSAVANAAFLSPLLALDRGFDVFDHRHALNSDVRRADESVDRALELVRKDRGTPHFLLLHLFDPHLNYDPPPPWGRRFTGDLRGPEPPLDLRGSRTLVFEGGDSRAYVHAVYLGEVGFVDRQIGRLVQALEADDRWDRCTFVVVADHGEEFGEHGDFEHGHTLYDELVAVPLAIRTAPETRSLVPAQVRMVDVLPTLLDLAGIAVPPSVAGRSLLPWIRGEARQDLVAFAEGTLYGGDQLAWNTGRDRLIVDVNAEPPAHLELYDAESDPAERRNLAAAEGERAAQLEQELGGFLDTLIGRAMTMSRPEPVSLTPDDVRRLESLGYLR